MSQGKNKETELLNKLFLFCKSLTIKSSRITLTDISEHTTGLKVLGGEIQIPNTKFTST